MKQIKLYEALIPIVVLVALLTCNVVIFGSDTLGGANQIVLFIAAAVAAIVATIKGLKWTAIHSSIINSIGAAMPSILILLLIGSLAGTWLLSGVVPTLIYYGLLILKPKIFLFASAIICCLVSLATGSSWSTVATIGIALMGIGSTLGIHEGLVAGAIVSGAYFGDKMSPLSDTTNLAPAMAGTDLFTHVRYMTITTIPAITLALIIYFIIGLTYSSDTNISEVNTVLAEIEAKFTISPLLLLVPVLLFAIIMKKVPPLPALLAGTLLGGIFAVIFQPHLIREIAGDTVNFTTASYIAVMKAMFGQISFTTNLPEVNDLLKTKGMAGMLNTVWLILAAMTFGGAMEAGGFLSVITIRVIKYAKTTGSLILSTVLTCLFFNLTASDQYISIVVPGRMFAPIFKQRGYKPELLSRTLEDSGTVTSALIPWNTCGATQASVLGVPTLTYLPYAFFNLISPVMSVIIAYSNIKIRRYTPEEMQKMEVMNN